MQEIKTLSDGFNELVVEFWPILERASNRGIPIDDDERNKLSLGLIKDKERIYKEIQGQVTDDIRGISPKDGYTKVPKIILELQEIYEDKIRGLEVKEGKRVISFDEFVAKQTFCEIVKKNKDKSDKHTGIFRKLRIARFLISKKGKKAVEPFEATRWVWVNDFNPNSSKQIIGYIKWKKHKVPIRLDGDETSEAKELERLAIRTGDLFYDQIIEYRQITKMLTNDIPNWSPDEETGAIHTQFGFHPATGQISSRKPNVQNANKHKPLGKRFRRIIRARDSRDRSGGRSGRRFLVELDYSGFHAIMLGREAQSERYINISQCDVHSWFASYIVGKPVEYPKLFNTDLDARQQFIDRLKEIKEAYKTIRDTLAKPSILGIGLGLGKRKLYWMNRQRFDKKSNQLVGIESETQAGNLQGMLKELLPELFEYQTRTKEEAFRKTYLISKWGMIRWFFDVRGEDGEAAIAFRVQNHAHGMLRWVLRRLNDAKDKQGISLLERFQFINTIHDSLVFHPFEEDVAKCIELGTRFMETPCKILADSKVCPEGLVVRADAMWGTNWAEFDEKVNPEGMKKWIGILD